MIDLHYYSPEELIEDKLFDNKKVTVHVKRDDLIHPFISGNKWRKLKYVLQQALTEEKSHLVTFGGAYSNHLLATACAAARFGFQSTGIVRGENVENDTLMLCKLFGMHLRFTDRTEYRDKPAIFNKWFGGDPKAFFIAEGGSGTEAVRGCAEMINELTGAYDHIFCASGTGTTAAGLLKGLTESRLSTILHSVPVFKDGSFIRTEIEQYFALHPHFSLHLDYHFGGYAKTQPELLRFMKKFSSATGILLDPVYSGKMFYGLYDLIGKNYFAEGSKILAVHTGGLLGLFGMKEKLYKSL
jgi:1-aminocyclopropane-1-carboxylate deaminase